MATPTPESRSRVIPALRYRDAPAAIEWLCAVFGFEKQVVFPTPEGHVAHAQLTLGGGMVMLASATGESEWGKLIRQPDELGGMESQGPYLFVDDADAVYERAIAMGAEIVIEIRDESYGGRGFTCRDLEGHLWAIGTFNPWVP